MSDEELVQYGLVKGFIGPVGLPEGVGACADESLRDSAWWTIGANDAGYHYVHANQGRDFTVGRWVDVITAKAGDICPKCGSPLKAARGIEVGQVFQLGTKYSQTMGATFADPDGVERPLQMGCYGIGVSRMLAAVVEQHHDEHGITFPVAVAPYEVEVVPLDVNDDVVWPVATRVAEELLAAGVEVIVDDRKERPGVKFADADLMGFPYQVVCGKKAIKNGNVELKVRATGERTEVAIEEAASLLANRVVSERA